MWIESGLPSQLWAIQNVYLSQPQHQQSFVGTNQFLVHGWVSVMPPRSGLSQLFSFINFKIAYLMTTIMYSIITNIIECCFPPVYKQCCPLEKVAYPKKVWVMLSHAHAQFNVIQGKSQHNHQLEQTQEKNYIILAVHLHTYIQFLIAPVFHMKYASE